MSGLSQQSEGTPSRLRRLIAIAQAGLQGARRAYLAAINQLVATNGSAFTTANPATFTSGNFTPTPGGRGKVQVQGMMSGITSAVDVKVTLQLLRDGVTAIGPAMTVDGGHVTAEWGGFLSWIDTTSPGVAHTYSIRATPASGTVTVAIAQASLVLIESP